MAAELQIHPARAKALLVLETIAQVRQDDGRSAPHEQLRRRHSTARRTDDGDALAADGEWAIDRHLSFNVVRLNNAKMIATMTNRVMTFGSLHPINSK